MLNDPVVREIRKIREGLAAKFDFDVVRLLRDAQKRQCEFGRETVRLKPRRPRNR
jgi:hypothetical protein